ncbi:hypothetical protein Tco_0657988 [Tanacetum coccineum]
MLSLTVVEKIIRYSMGNEDLNFVMGVTEAFRGKGDSHLNINFRAPKTPKYYVERSIVSVLGTLLLQKKTKGKSVGERLRDVTNRSRFSQKYARVPYRLALSEMKEFSEKLQELSDKGFIRPSSSPWGAPVFFEYEKKIFQRRDSELGLVSYFQRFIEGFSKIAKPMTKLTQKKVAFEWVTAREAAFQTLKDKLCSAPILSSPSWS